MKLSFRLIRVKLKVISAICTEFARFYNALFNGELGFEQIKEFHSYPTLAIGNLALSGVEGWKLEIPDEGAEETWSVFDHPVIRVFKKNASFTREDYARFLES